jgi:XrtJ-associated TM-motif-TM protein
LEKRMNLKKTLLALSFAVILAVAMPLRAQTGCDDSPEDPTIVLALVGGAGALGASLWRFLRK